MTTRSHRSAFLTQERSQSGQWTPNVCSGTPIRIRGSIATFSFMRRLHAFAVSALIMTSSTACVGSTAPSIVMYDLATVNGGNLPAPSSSGTEITQGVLTLVDHDLSFAMGITALGQDSLVETSWTQGSYVDADSTVEFTIRKIDGTELPQGIVFTGTRQGDTMSFESREGDEYMFRRWPPQ